MKQWSKDHWKLLDYVRECCEEAGGKLDPTRLREDGDRFPTVTRGWTTSAPGHSDFDCLNDFYEAGLLKYRPDPLCLWAKLTDIGWSLSLELRGHLAAKGNTLLNFDPKGV